MMGYKSPAFSLPSLSVARAFTAAMTPDSEKLIIMRNSEEETLVRKIQSGRADLFSKLVQLHSDSLMRVILRLVPTRLTAEDVLQETWETVVRKFHSYDVRRPLIPWLTKIAVNRCRDHLRRERLRRIWRRVLREDDEIQDADKIEGENGQRVDDQIAISSALTKLSPKLREVVVLKFFSDLTHDEIASVLGIPSGTVKSRLFYALAQLKQLLGDRSETADE